MTLLSTLVDRLTKGKFPRQRDIVETDTRTAIRSVGTDDIVLDPTQQAIADAYDRLPRQCRRAVDRSHPSSWITLKDLTNCHRTLGHKPGGTDCRA